MRENTAGKKARTRLIVFLVLAGILVLLGIFAPMLTPNDPDATNALNMNKAPCPEFPFGTDRYGRCICSRVMIGARTSIFSAVTLVAVTFAVGTVLGMLIIAVMNNLLNLVGVPTFLREAFKGFIVVAAVLLQKKERTS